MKWLVDTTGMEQCKVEACISRRMTNKRVSLTIGVHVDNIIMSGEKDVCNLFFGELKERLNFQATLGCDLTFEQHQTVT